MLVRRSNIITRFTLPVVIKNYKTIWYYDCENDCFKAYWQLKKINGLIKPLYPVIY